MKIANNITELIGNTPLVRISKLNETSNLVAGKLEYFNPANSVKDRIAVNMINMAEQAGQIRAGETILIEPTSGNTGIGLAFVAAIKGYKLILTMPEAMSVDHRKILLAYGAEVILTEAAQGMQGAIAKAEELHAKHDNSIILQQFANQANVKIHQQTTAAELWNDTKGKLDIFVAGVGTGGTITGVGKTLKELNPAIKIIAVEPQASPVLSGGIAGVHKIQGIGAGFVPEILDRSVIDEIFLVSNKNAINTARNLALKEGILGCVSSGAAAYAALEIAKRSENQNKVIAFMVPSYGERYLSSVLFEHISV